MCLELRRVEVNDQFRIVQSGGNHVVNTANTLDVVANLASRRAQYFVIGLSEDKNHDGRKAV